MRRSSKWVVAGAALLSGFGLTANQVFAESCSTDGCSTYRPTSVADVFADPGCGTGGCATEGCGTEGCDDCCDLGDAWALSDGEDGIKLGGWFQAGYTSKSTGLFNTDPDRLNLNQGWLYLEKTADGSKGPDWGFRTDLMYGTDANDTQAFGNNPGRWDYLNGFDYGGGYGWAMPQAYLEYANGDWSIKVGHFFTLVGYEVVTAPDNFFYSHAITMYNSEPFTHTGALATYSGIENLELYGGWTAGWDTGFDQFGNGSSFLGGASLTLSENSTFTYITTIGDFGARTATPARPVGTGSGSYSHSLVLDAAITDDLNWVLQSDYVNDGAKKQYGLNNYLIYTVNDCLGYGIRAEWWHDTTFLTGGDFYEVTAGVNYRVHSNLIVRPEVRWEDYATTDDQTIFGIDAILTF
jgi:hypothetical protein